MKRGFQLSVEVAAKVLQMSGGESVSSNFWFAKPLREPFKGLVVKPNEDLRNICAVVAMLNYRQGAASMQWKLPAVFGFLSFDGPC